MQTQVLFCIYARLFFSCSVSRVSFKVFFLIGTVTHGAVADIIMFLPSFTGAIRKEYTAQ